MKNLRLTTTLIAASLIATSAFAQMGPGKGGRFAWNQDYTQGWTLMSAQERTEWQTKMGEAKTYDECKALQDEHRKTMEARATEKGVKLAAPRQNGCDVMKARGFIK
jgi:hypothetical protein